MSIEANTPKEVSNKPNFWSPLNGYAKWILYCIVIIILSIYFVNLFSWNPDNFLKLFTIIALFSSLYFTIWMHIEKTTYEKIDKCFKLLEIYDGLSVKGGRDWYREIFNSSEPAKSELYFWQEMEKNPAKEVDLIRLFSFWAQIDTALENKIIDKRVAELTFKDAFKQHYKIFNNWIMKSPSDINRKYECFDGTRYKKDLSYLIKSWVR
jgi:hypothetical protein